MRRLLATASNFALLSVSLAGATLIAPLSYGGQSLPVHADRSAVGNVRICGSEDVVVDEHNESNREVTCPVHARTPTEVAEARAYLAETASPGYTMTLQGPELAIERLHPEFAVRLANAIREARDSGLSSAGIFSAYRPPAFGVGGFADKFNSLHSYGLAVDLTGIGGPGSPEAQHWHEIASRNGVVCPYGPSNRTEWNHCQPTGLKIVGAHNPLRDTITADGPLSLEDMFEVGDAIIENGTVSADYIPNDVPVHLMAHDGHSGKPQERLVRTAAGAAIKRTLDRAQNKTDRGHDRKLQTAASKTRKQGQADAHLADKAARPGGKQVLAKRSTTIEEKRGMRKAAHHLTLVVVSGMDERA
jgi:hypothetical protein